ncbi:MAG: hypothetical protein H9W81_07645 [Enterococcus sp.]|nr:hypothetical protein [Enterococcus sp.]
MATVLLPVTNVELPSSDWEIRNFKENKSFSEETMCFKATLVHLPTGVRCEISNEGHGGSDLMFWDQRQKNVAEVEQMWKQFVKDCQPALRLSVADDPNEWVRNLYSGDYISEESVVGLFTTELSNQKMLSRKRGTVVRKNADDKDFLIYKHTPEVLMGRVQGEYWNKAEKNWSSL